MSGTVNETIVIDRFQSYLDSGTNIQDATDGLILDCLNEGLTDDEIVSVVQDILVPSIAIRFAESWESSRKKYEPGDYFSVFCKFGHIGEDLENAVATFINETAAAEENEDNNIVFKPDEWAALSDEQRLERVKNFLCRLASSARDFSQNKSFISSLNVGKDSYGNDFSAGVKTFYRAAHRYGHLPDEEQEDDEGNRLKTATIPTTNESVAAEDEDRHFANAHPLAKVLKNHGYGYRKTLRATAIKPVVTVTPHHIWVNHANHMVIAAEGDTKWKSKVSPHSGHSWEGVGAQSLDKHLSLKNKRYKKQLEQHSLPTTPLMENLLQGSDRVKKYANFMSRNPFSSLGHQLGNDSLVKAQRDSLIESWRLREDSERKFGSSEANTDYRAASLHQLNERKKKND